MQNLVRDAFTVAFKKIGYSLNSKSQDEVDKALQLLINQAPLVQAYVIDEVKKDPAAYPSQEILDQCEVYIDLGNEMTNYYNEKWNELKASLN